MNEVHYSVRVKNGSGWRAYPSVRLMISVGQPYHEGEKLEAVVDWINRNPVISTVHISVNDLLQRHNLVAIGLPLEKAAKISASEGSLWLARNMPILSEIKVKTFYTRWDEWLLNPEHKKVYAELIAYKLQDAAFAEAIEADSHLLLNRRKKRNESIPDERVFVHNSRQYILEELAVFSQQCRHLPAAEIYPGSNLSSAQNLIGKSLPPLLAPLSERYFTRIDFARLHSFAPITQNGQDALRSVA